MENSVGHARIFTNIRSLSALRGHILPYAEAGAVAPRVFIPPVSEGKAQNRGNARTVCQVQGASGL